MIQAERTKDSQVKERDYEGRRKEDKIKRRGRTKMESG